MGMSKQMIAEAVDAAELPGLVTKLLDDEHAGWSIGIFGAVGEFMRVGNETVSRCLDLGEQCLVTERGGIRIDLHANPTILAYNTLSGDGYTWTNSLAFCVPVRRSPWQQRVRAIGFDSAALRGEDRDAVLFDLGIGIGRVRFCLRTRDHRLINTLRALEGKPARGALAGEVMAEVLRAQPHRVLVSPAGRIEVFSRIPGPGDVSPEGPHTHLLPDLIRKGRTHDSNMPIPQGYQPVMMLHPGPVRHDPGSGRAVVDPDRDADFDDLLERYGLPEETRIRSAVEAAVASGIKPADFDWPKTRRGRAVARVALRRIAHRRPDALLAAWRAHYDHTRPRQESP